jgi:hypothetical protein
MEEQMARRPIFLEENKKPLKPEADDQSHKPAKRIEEIARLAAVLTAATAAPAYDRWKKSGDEQKDTDQLGTGDLLNAAKMPQRSEQWISEQ